eukprot:9965210-Alexandrium_andersonii.AAC.1
MSASLVGSEMCIRDSQHLPTAPLAEEPGAHGLLRDSKVVVMGRGTDVSVDRPVVRRLTNGRPTLH